MALCKECGGVLTFNEVGLYRRMVDREPFQCLCKTCLAKQLSCSVELLDQKIRELIYLECSLVTEDE